MKGLQQSDVVELAVWLTDVQKDYWSAARLWFKLANSDQSQFGEFSRCAVQALERIPSGSQSGALTLEVEIRTALMIVSDIESTKDGCLEWMMLLEGDPTRFNQLDPMNKARVETTVGQSLIGFRVIISSQ